MKLVHFLAFIEFFNFSNSADQSRLLALAVSVDAEVDSPDPKDPAGADEEGEARLDCATTTGGLLLLVFLVKRFWKKEARTSL